MRGRIAAVAVVAVMVAAVVAVMAGSAGAQQALTAAEVIKGIDLPTVGNLMGHSDIETTMVYAHLAPEHLEKAVARLPFRRQCH